MKPLRMPKGTFSLLFPWLIGKAREGAEAREADGPWPRMLQKWKPHKNRFVQTSLETLWESQLCPTTIPVPDGVPQCVGEQQPEPVQA